ncbi:CRISPR-associated helicase Cas3' [Streptomyces sp. NBC_01500]|uniref:CRISPR-associated helicase Cas3' n=1 Tax=Streptomyces sp. NBC_01500 TaxID=2903886 RepID=UPI002259F00F|nr:CRISPR-associated helicase Cas3' [Streptomyces sp. NBC_01500]MCX4554288.1 CRISPR-associated helicase Cas3' [Streptomyces sp. NBC_01500]
MNCDETASTDVSLDTRMWGKQKGLPRPYPVVCHLLDTAAVFQALWRVVLGSQARVRVAEALELSVEDSCTVLSFWAGLHDLGKVSPPFQAQVAEAYASLRDDPAYGCAPSAEQTREFRHEMATHWSLTQLLADAGYPGVGKPVRTAVSHQVAQMLGGHHGCFGPVLKVKELAQASAYRPGLGSDGWAQQRHAHFTELRRAIGARAVPQRGLPTELAVIVAGLVVVADWVASQTSAIKPRMPPPGWEGTPAEIDAHWQGAQRAAPGLVCSARLGRAEFAAGQFSDMFPFVPNALQTDLTARLPGLVTANGTGLVLITAPTGDGKTEASLYAASLLGRAAGARGIYFALPTMATADAMFPRVGAYASKALTGERALTLLHSMAWLSPAYTGADHDFPASHGCEVSADRDTAIEAGAWLRGAKRGLLAPLGAGTIDQALSAVLPLKHNALRLFGLSDKVFVVDEAHAYGPWMHQLLLRLLEWMGAFRAPVVLLSATLTGRTATALVDAYRRGAGFADPSAVDPCYPGWLFASAGTGEVSTPVRTATDRARTLNVSVRKVEWDVGEAPAQAPRVEGRREVLREVLRAVAEEGGTALVCCTTVVEAQQTFRDLRAAFPDLAARDGGLRLLHSRYPADARAQITACCEVAYGKPRGPEDVAQPRAASVLIATQVVEQSLDFDFDLVVSDLAPIAQLLQRAGRGRRHERGASGRPCWAHPEDQPELVVLDPFIGTDGGELPPRTWGTVYDAGLLRRTSHILTDCSQKGIAVPGDVQHLIDRVYERSFVDGLTDAAQEEVRRMDSERQAGEMAQTHLAAMVGICSPADVKGNLHLLSRHEEGVTQELLTTRLGADTGRVLCLYEQEDGRATLDAAGTVPLPLGGRHGLTRGELTAVATRVAPVPGRWLRTGEPGAPRPVGWGDHLVLRDLVLLRMTPNQACPEAVWGCLYGDRNITVSDVGLEYD